MKKFNKILALALAVVLVLALSATVFADTKNDSITVNGVKAGETYDLYKLFDLVVNDEMDPSAYSYTVNSDWAAFFAPASGETPAGAGNQYVTINDAGYVTAISDAAALAKAAAEWSGKPAAAQSETVSSGDSVTFSGLPDGYWLITSTLGTIAMAETTPDASAVTVNEKNPEDSVEKTVQEDTAYAAENDAQIGDTVNYQVTINLVKGTRNVVFHDEMEDGLTYTTGSPVITGLTEGTEYTLDENPADGHTFDIIFDDAYLAGLADGTTTLTLTYSAVLNENAIDSSSAIDPQTNKGSLSYGDATSVESETTTTTHSFSVFKHAKNATDNLAGAVFSLKKNGTVVPLVKIDDNTYRVANPSASPAETTTDTFVTVASGDIVILGVDTDGPYTLEEITPPDGYNALTADVDVTVDADNSTRVDVENSAGNELPSTGGIGTTIFYVLGGILAVGAAVLLIAKKRMGTQA